MLLSQRMNYINRPKSAYTQEERIKYLEESIRELRKEKENLKKEKGELKSRLEEENKKLKEELAHYKNTEAIQKSNNASRYNPYNHKSYVDREFRKEYTEEEQELLDLDYGTWFTAKFVNR